MFSLATKLGGWVHPWEPVAAHASCSVCLVPWALHSSSQAGGQPVKGARKQCRDRRKEAPGARNMFKFVGLEDNTFQRMTEQLAFNVLSHKM